MDIVFSDSACGSLKIAQHYGEGEYQGCIGVSVVHEDGSEPTRDEVRAALREAEETERLAWENAVPLGGNPGDIFGFHLALSIGDISENPPGVKRQQVLEQLFNVYPDGDGPGAAHELFSRAAENLAIVRRRANEGQPLRIWYSSLPDEMCGLYWFMSQLNQWNMRDGQVSLVRLPEWEADGDGNIVQKSGWAEVAPQDWGRYRTLQQPVPPLYIQCCAYHWQALREENAPLRALLNGRVVSMPETLYDCFILREIAAEGAAFHEAKLIGRILGKYPLGFGDTWVALRIEEMIRAGRLAVASDAAAGMPAYHRVLKKV